MKYFAHLVSVFARLLVILVVLLGFLPTPAYAAPTGVITLWHTFDPGSADETALNAIITNAEAAFTGLDIQPEYHSFGTIYDDYTQAYNTGSGPDLWIAPNDTLGDFARAGSIVDITSEVNVPTDLVNVKANAIDGMKVGDSLYGIPESFNALALFYDQSVITPPTTTAELLDMVQNQGKTFATEGGSYYFYPYWGAFGGQVMDGTGLCVATNNTGMADAMDYMLSLQNAGANVMADFNTVQTGFEDGTFDMVVGGPWMNSTYTAALGANLGVIVLPDGPSANSKPMVGTNGFYFNPNSAVPLADLVDLALYMTNNNSSQIWMDTARHTPVRTDINVIDSVVQAFADAADQGEVRPQISQLGNYWGPFYDMSIDVLSNGIPSSVAVMRACNKMNVYNGFTPGPNTYVLWHSYTDGENDALNQVIAGVHATDLTLTIVPVFVPFENIFNDYLNAVLVDGAGPDLLIVPNDLLGDHTRAGAVLNLTSYINEGTDLANVQQTAIDGMKVGGVLYGIPESAKAVALYYNKSAITTPPATTTELLNMVQSQGKTFGTTGGPYFNYPFWGSFNGQLMNNSGFCIASQTNAFASAMSYFVSLRNAGAEMRGDYATVQNDFIVGNYDMIVDGPWGLTTYKAALGADLGVAILPDGPTLANAKPLTGIDGFYVNPNKVANATTLVDLALAMTNQASAQIWMDTGSHIPVRTDVTVSDPLIETFAQAAAQGEARPQNPQFSNYWTPFADAINFVLDGTVAPATAVTNACRQMNELNGFTVSQTFSSNGTHDGYILESSETSGNGGTMNSSASTLNLGDNSVKRQYRSILSFNTSALPDNAVITKVTLKLRRQGVAGGGNPVTMFQGFMTDIKKGTFGTAPLALADFKTTANKTIGPSSPALTAGWYNLNLTPAKAYINKLATGGGLTQIRVRFKLDDNNNAIANYLKIYSGNASATSRPQLIVEYYIP